MHAGLAALADESGKPPGATLFAGLVTKVKAAVTNREAIRLAMGKQVILARSFFDPRTFSKPESREVALARVRANFASYRSLYAVLGLVVLLYTVLSSPMLLLGLSMLVGAWAFAFVLNAPEDPITVAGASRCKHTRQSASLTIAQLRLRRCSLSICHSQTSSPCRL